MNIFEEAQKRLDYLIQNNIDSYHFLRNYDYGISNRTNVSQISKYTSHRIIYEYDILKKLKEIDKKKKFSDEILWRLYWKGYLENHNSIWIKYKNFKFNSFDSTILENAKNGTTGIECFDTWLEELRENSYLHNHTRMWFASIWIFTLRLPWQLGANLFMKHLLDGDASSNTLSWRWVAGIHTNKKPYIASKDNINKFTINRFKNISINTSNQINIIVKDEYLPNRIPIQKNFFNSNILIMFDNDLNISNRSKLFNSYSKVYIVLNKLVQNRFRMNENVILFKEYLINNVNKLIPNSEILNSNDLDIILEYYKSIDVIYPGIGSNLDLVNKFRDKKQININYIYRKEDLFNWGFAKSGFYKFKKSFNTINKNKKL